MTVELVPVEAPVRSRPEIAAEILARPWPEEPMARLVWAKHVWRVRCEVQHEWEIRTDGHSYAGIGWAYETPNPNAQVFIYGDTRGEGKTAIEAVDDWFGKLPEGPIETLIWRVKPELNSERDFDTKSTMWMAYSRFAIVRPKGAK